MVTCYLSKWSNIYSSPGTVLPIYMPQSTFVLLSVIHVKLESWNLYSSPWDYCTGPSNFYMISYHHPHFTNRDFIIIAKVTIVLAADPWSSRIYLIICLPITDTLSLPTLQFISNWWPSYCEIKWTHFCLLFINLLLVSESPEIFTILCTLVASVYPIFHCPCYFLTWDVYSSFFLMSWGLRFPCASILDLCNSNSIRTSQVTSYNL